jgi:hypothetical protein
VQSLHGHLESALREDPLFYLYHVQLHTPQKDLLKLIARREMRRNGARRRSLLYGEVVLPDFRRILRDVVLAPHGPWGGRGGGENAGATVGDGIGASAAADAADAAAPAAAGAGADGISMLGARRLRFLDLGSGHGLAVWAALSTGLFEESSGVELLQRRLDVACNASQAIAAGLRRGRGGGGGGDKDGEGEDEGVEREIDEITGGHGETVAAGVVDVDVDVDDVDDDDDGDDYDDDARLIAPVAAPIAASATAPIAASIAASIAAASIAAPATATSTTAATATATATASSTVRFYRGDLRDKDGLRRLLAGTGADVIWMNNIVWDGWLRRKVEEGLRRHFGSTRGRGGAAGSKAANGRRRDAVILCNRRLRSPPRQYVLVDMCRSRFTWNYTHTVYVYGRRPKRPRGRVASKVVGGGGGSGGRGEGGEGGGEAMSCMAGGGVAGEGCLESGAPT